MARKALVVEDDPDVGLLMAEQLRGWGFDPTLLQSGGPAVGWVKDHRPELILLDLMLPEKNGFDICQELKVDRETNLIPIVMVTARVQPEDRIHGLEVGANEYVTKPFAEEQLHSAVRRALSWREELQRHGTQGEVRFQLRSATKHLEELNHLLASLFLFTGLSQKQIRQLTMAVYELGTNAIEWGHRHQVDRIVTVTYRIDPEKVTIKVRDTGPGFDPRDLPHAAQPDDPAAHLLVRENLGLREGGFGIWMARGLVDELQYNESGNEASLVKYLPTAPQP